MRTNREECSRDEKVCCDSKTYRNPCAAQCDGCTGHTQGQCQAAGWTGQVSTNFTAISPGASKEFMERYQRCQRRLRVSYVSPTTAADVDAASCSFDSLKQRFMDVYPGIRARTSEEWAREMFNKVEEVREAQVQQELEDRISSSGGRLSDDDKRDIALSKLNRTDVSPEEVEDVLEDLAAQAAGDRARSCFENAHTATARRLCDEQIKRTMGARLGRNVTDIEQKELLKKGAARAAEEKLERCILQGRTRQDCIDSEVKAQIAKTLGKNDTDVDEAEVQELLEDSAQETAFEEIQKCRRNNAGASQRDCAKSDAVKSAYLNVFGVDSTADVDDTEITARIKKGAAEQAAKFVGECSRLAGRNATAQRLCKTKSGVKDAVSTALGKDQIDVTDLDVETYLIKGAKAKAETSMSACVDAAGDDNQKLQACRTSDELREAVRQALGREENVTVIELQQFVMEGAARSAADMQKDCMKKARTEQQRIQCRAELKRSLKKKLGRTTEVSDTEAIQFARDGAADVAAEYIASCQQDSTASSGSCLQSSAVKEAIASSLGKNASEIAEEDVRAMARKGAEKSAANAVSICMRTATTAAERRLCRRNTDTKAAVAASLGKDAAQVTDREVVRIVEQGLRKKANDVMSACKSSKTSGDTTSCLDSDEVLDNLRAALGKPDAPLDEVKQDLKEAAKSKAKQMADACSDAGNTGCRTSDDVKRAVREGLGDANAPEDTVIAVLQRGEELDAAETASGCDEQDKNACIARIREALKTSGAAEDDQSAEAILTRGVQSRAVDSMEACAGDAQTSGSSPDAAALGQCVDGVIADTRSALGGSTATRRMLRMLRRELSQTLASSDRARKSLKAGTRRKMGERISTCVETKQSRSEDTTTCVSDASLNDILITSEGTAVPTGTERKRAVADGEVAQFREKNEAIADVERDAADAGAAAPFTEQQKANKRKQARVAATAQADATVEGEKLRDQELRRDAGSSAMVEIAEACGRVTCSTTSSGDTFEKARARATGEPEASSSTAEGKGKRKRHRREAARALLRDQLEACIAEGTTSRVTCAADVRSTTSELRESKFADEDLQAAARDGVLRNMSACVRAAGGAAEACRVTMSSSKAALGLESESMDETIARGAENALVASSGCADSDRVQCRNQDKQRLRDMGVDNNAVDVKRRQAAPMAMAAVLADCLEGKGASIPVDDSECHTLVQTTAGNLGYNYNDRMKAQVERIADKKRSGQVVELETEAAVDVAVSYDGQCNSARTADVQADIERRCGTVGASKPQEVDEPYTDSDENKCRVYYKAKMSGKSDAEVKTAAATIRSTPITLANRRRLNTQASVSADQTLRAESDNGSSETSDNAGISVGLIAGVVAGVVALALIGAAAFIIIKRKNNMQEEAHSLNTVELSSTETQFNNPLPHSKRMQVSNTPVVIAMPVAE